MSRRYLTYEDFLRPADVATYKRVKRQTMALGEIGRDVVVTMLAGEAWIPEKGKQFLHTRHGLYRFAMSHNSDNTTEVAAHQHMGAETVTMGDFTEIRSFFARHGLDGLQACREWYAEVQRRVDML